MYSLFSAELAEAHISDMRQAASAARRARQARRARRGATAVLAGLRGDSGPGACPALLATPLPEQPVSRAA
jgi:hypothetical protein